MQRNKTKNESMMNKLIINGNNSSKDYHLLEIVIYYVNIYKDQVTIHAIQLNETHIHGMKRVWEDSFLLN